MLGLQTPTVPPQGLGVWEGATWTGNFYNRDGTVANAVLGQAAQAARADYTDEVDEVPTGWGGWGFLPNRPFSTNNGLDNGWPITRPISTTGFVGLVVGGGLEPTNGGWGGERVTWTRADAKRCKEQRPLGIKLGVLPAGWGSTALLPALGFGWAAGWQHVFNPRGALYLRKQESKKSALRLRVLPVGGGGWGIIGGDGVVGGPVGILYSPGC